MAMSKAEAGRLGGRATVAKHGATHMSRIGKDGFAALEARFGDRGMAVSYLRKQRGMPGLPVEQWPQDCSILQARRAKAQKVVAVDVTASHSRIV